MQDNIQETENEKEASNFLERYEIKRIKNDFVQKITLLVIASFGVVAALAWNEALKLVFSRLFGSTESILSMLLYALAVTVLAVIVSVILGKLFIKDTKKQDK